MLDALLLRKHMVGNKTIPEDKTKLKQTHEAVNMKLREDMDQANCELDNFILETKEEDNLHLTAISSAGSGSLGSQQFSCSCLA